jgi:hypothetical protein
MNEKFLLAFADGHFVVVDESGSVIHVLLAGGLIELSLRGFWQVVQVQSGGYKGWYYVTASGEYGRFAVSQQVRLCQEGGAASAASSPASSSAHNAQSQTFALPVLVPLTQNGFKTARLNGEFLPVGEVLPWVSADVSYTPKRDATW